MPTNTISLESRRGFLRRFKLLYAPLMLSATSSYAYGSLLERHRLTVERHEVKLALGARAPRRFRAVTLTDFHFDPLCETGFVQECVRRTNALQPDVVFLTGDYITRVSRRFDDFAQALGELRSRAGVFACLGNHDYRDGVGNVAGALNRQHIGVLRNQHTRIRCAGGELVVAGLESAWGSAPDWAVTSRGIRPDDRVLALIHEPDYAKLLANDERIAMQFSGHTHGGQVRMPGIGALLLPPWGQEHQAGFYDLRKLKLYVNRGVGTIRYHVRFLCPPEIACFDVTNTDAA